VWPPQGENYTFDNGKTTYIGADRFNPLFLNRRLEQSTSRWTLKLIAYTAPADSAPVDFTSLAQEQTVQDVFADALMLERAMMGRPPEAPETPAWYTWDFRIDYKT